MASEVGRPIGRAPVPEKLGFSSSWSFSFCFCLSSAFFCLFRFGFAFSPSFAPGFSQDFPSLAALDDCCKPVSKSEFINRLASALSWSISLEFWFASRAGSMDFICWKSINICPFLPGSAAAAGSCRPEVDFEKSERALVASGCAAG